MWHLPSHFIGQNPTNWFFFNYWPTDSVLSLWLNSFSWLALEFESLDFLHGCFPVMPPTSLELALQQLAKSERQKNKTGSLNRPVSVFFFSFPFNLRCVQPQCVSSSSNYTVNYKHLHLLTLYGKHTHTHTQHINNIDSVNWLHLRTRHVWFTQFEDTISLRRTRM